MNRSIVNPGRRLIGGTRTTTVLSVLNTPRGDTAAWSSFGRARPTSTPRAPGQSIGSDTAGAGSGTTAGG
jgi:hypothetical protein